MGEAIFGKYRLIAELGHGGMADVFLAVVAGPAGSGFSKLTVIKRLRQNLADEAEFIEMLVDEARISARLNHPNVVQTNEVGAVDNVYFISMEYLDGQPFHRIQHRAFQVEKRALETRAAEELSPDSNGAGVPTTDSFAKSCQYLVLLDALAGLHHAHELQDYDGTPLQIVHRDVTPHNIFVTYEGQVKVVDFGIAKAAGRSSETRQGVVKGKVRYMAPEQAIGQHVDRRADLFSVGVMLWEAATGRRLWKDMDDIHIVEALVSGKIKKSPREVDPNVPVELDRICQKALAQNREDRYATAEDFRVDLEQHLAETGMLVAARRKLGPSVSTLFVDKRTELRAVIERQLQALKARSPSSLLPVATDSASVSQAVLSSASAVALTLRPDGSSGIRGMPCVSEGALSELSAAAHLRSPFSKFRLPMFTAAAAVAIAIGALVVSRVAARPQPDPKTLTTGPSPETSFTDVRLKVATSPPNAEISIDGASVGSPYEARLPADKRDHILKVEAPGFDPHVETIRYERDTVRFVKLVTTKVDSNQPQAHSSPSVGHALGMPSNAAGPVKVVVNARDAPPPPALPYTAAPAPGSSLKGSKPDIDKGDPWGTR